MDIGKSIKDALSSLNITVRAAPYRGNEKKYIVWNTVTERAETFASNKPQDEIVYLQVHFFTKESPEIDKRQIRKALFKAGFSYPSSSGPIYEDDTKLYHVTFETNIDQTPETEEI